MKKFNFFIPVFALLLAVAAAFGTQAAKRSNDLFAAVDYKSPTCTIDPLCHTSPTGPACSTRYMTGTNCTHQVAAWFKSN